VNYLELEDVLGIAYVVTDGAVKVRDMGLLASAVARPQGQALGTEFYPTVWEKAAALMQSLACNHPLFDGNKRTAWIACMTFLGLNGAPSLRPDIDAAEVLVLNVATSKIDDVRAIAEALRGLAE
jgi:death-on-curing protein